MTQKCTEIIRGPNTGLPRPCPGEVSDSGICSKSAYHKSQVKTGFCMTRRCEGSKPKVDDVPQKTCSDWQFCPCKCHDDMSRILAIKKQPRTAIPDEYVPKAGTFAEFLARWEMKQSPESKIKRICEEWEKLKPEEECTVAYVLRKYEGGKKPTRADVEEIFNRWFTARIAFTGGNPVKFIKFLGPKKEEGESE